MAVAISVPMVALAAFTESADVDAATVGGSAIVARAVAVVSGSAAVVSGFGHDAAGERQQSRRDKRVCS
jgi:hypothetical protein